MTLNEMQADAKKRFLRIPNIYSEIPYEVTLSKSQLSKLLSDAAITETMGYANFHHENLKHSMEGNQYVIETYTLRIRYSPDLKIMTVTLLTREE